MKLKFLQSMAGIDFSHNVSDIIEVNDAKAIKRYVESGIAQIVKTTKKETSAKKTAPHRKKTITASTATAPPLRLRLFKF